MANASIHEKQAKHNYELLNSLLKTKFKDWRITVAYYTAVQIIDCQLTYKTPTWREVIFSTKNLTYHQVRTQGIQRQFSDIWINFRTLEERSRLVRYLEGTNKIAVDTITDSDEKECLNMHLKAILNKFNYKW